MHLLLLMSVNILDFICTCTGCEERAGRDKIKPKNVCLQRDSNLSKSGVLDHSATLTEMFKCAYNFA